MKSVTISYKAVPKRFEPLPSDHETKFQQAMLRYLRAKSSSMVFLLMCAVYWDACSSIMILLLATDFTESADTIVDSRIMTR